MRIKEHLSNAKREVDNGVHRACDWVDDHGGSVVRTLLVCGLCYTCGKLTGMKEQRESELEIEQKRREERNTLYRG